MATFRIVSTKQRPCGAGGHIEAVGVGDGSSPSGQILSVSDVHWRMSQGDTFYTYAHGLRADVRKFDCGCTKKTLRSAPDATVHNNLDNLPQFS
ncbi:DUF3892 domain-containing protein [Allokutzneria sp. NRRL B-24872]|uniref:DUF3892 domain-containing protein n=1 Tax=Allokutzneria sp. NRRL B-24872 TaxID=1137961 RepID=UPI000A361BCB